MPSAYEALGLVTTEVTLIGLPVIGIDSGATKKLIVNNERGYKYSEVISEIYTQLKGER